MPVSRRGFLKAAAVIGAALCVSPERVIAELNERGFGLKPAQTEGRWEKKIDQVRKAALMKQGKTSIDEALADIVTDWFNNNDDYKFPKKLTKRDLKFHYEDFDLGEKRACIVSYTGAYLKRIKKGS